MASDHSVDIVSKVNFQELRNALQQAQKEVGTRFDFRGTSAGIEFQETPPILKVTGDHQAQLRGVVDVLETKLAKRGVPMNALAWDPAEMLPSGSMKQQATVQQGLSSDHARAIVKTIKDLGLKVQPRIDGDAVRVSGKQLDDLQAAIRAVQGKNLGISIQAENYR